MNHPWFSVRRDGSDAGVSIFDEIDVTSEGASALLAQVGDAPNVELRIDSLGGHAGTALDVVEGLHGRNVIATITGRAFSSGYTLALAAPRIRMERRGTILIHSPKLFAHGTPAELRQSAKRLEKICERWHRLLVERTGQPDAVVSEWLGGKDFWFTADEALAAGLVDEIYDEPPLPFDLVTGEPLTAGTIDDGSERLFLELLRAMGTVRTKDKAKLGREIGAWFTYNVTETP